MVEWNTLIQTQTEDVEAVALKESPIGESHAVTFDSVFTTDNGSIGAFVTTELAGRLIWLFSPEYGPQNGLHSLIAATGEATSEGLEGHTVNYTRVESEKSPVGYAHRWSVEG